MDITEKSLQDFFWSFYASAAVFLSFFYLIEDSLFWIFQKFKYAQLVYWVFSTDFWWLIQMFYFVFPAWLFSTWSILLERLSSQAVMWLIDFFISSIISDRVFGNWNSIFMSWIHFLLPFIFLFLSSLKCLNEVIIMIFE